ncbi:MAG: sodium:calcium antiporter [Haloferacaceae archaeon]
MVGLVGYAALALVATAFVWKGSTMLERSGERLSEYYGLPPVVHGAVVVAIGSSFPELSSAVLSTLLHGEFELGVGAIVGSAIFNVLVIPSVSRLASDGPLDSGRDVVYKETQFYMLSVAVLLLTFSLAVIYNPVADGRLVGQLTRPLALVPILLYGLYVFIQYQDTSEYEAEVAPSDATPTRAWATLAVSLLVILIAVEGMVQAALGFGRLLDTPSFLWGLTVVAAGTSLPDALVSVRAARRDESTTSLANVLGSNIFDLLVAVPAGVLVAGATPIDFEVAVPMMGVLTLATILLFTLLRTELTLTHSEAWTLLIAYGVFIAWLVTETVGLTHVLPT